MLHVENEIREFFDKLTKDDLKSLLVEAGFEVEDGIGQVIYSQELEGEVSFKLTSPYQGKPNEFENNGENITAFPMAS